jgi:hypothetical protein
MKKYNRWACFDMIEQIIETSVPLNKTNKDKRIEHFRFKRLSGSDSRYLCFYRANIIAVAPLMVKG